MPTIIIISALCCSLCALLFLLIRSPQDTAITQAIISVLKWVILLTLPVVVVFSLQEQGISTDDLTVISEFINAVM